MVVEPLFVVMEDDTSVFPFWLVLLLLTTVTTPGESGKAELPLLPLT